VGPEGHGRPVVHNDNLDPGDGLGQGAGHCSLGEGRPIARRNHDRCYRGQMMLQG
jgi:hypothetical protein